MEMPIKDTRAETAEEKEARLKGKYYNFSLKASYGDTK